ncbi:winged helix-turn-helix domain-containing protein [Actinoplanes sp. TRM 88003]|uniref:Winged helix-turn-helix domain-containing protein n=1 Tax=Paractinoplanes aksuensis TaxID=2939490 RepID=A0ABT1DS88_9ACTN|nr:BTAD domain-containing putative transcriptional regulator [Actinoplanes aksuensis]MCO8273690.1 winged helix-turn-helix domain-containing protein [Actinoplanes aksuensis]
MTMRLQVLGPLRVWLGDTEVDAGPNQQQCLLALLLASAGEPVGIQALVEMLWGFDAPPSALNIIHKYVGQLRRLLEPGLPPRAPGAYLTRHGNGYRFAAGPETLDLLRFRQLVAEARACADHDDALDRYAEALQLGHGVAGAGLADTTAARTVFVKLHNEFVDAVVTAARLALRLGQPARLLDPVRRAAEMDPLNELVHAGLVTMLAAAGRPAEALALYRAVRERLGAELGIDPGPELQDAYLGVLARSGPPARTIHPAQLPPDLPLFAGRTTELATLNRLAAGLRAPGRTSPLIVALSGPAGVGKSALALRFAHLVAGDFTDGQLYLDLGEDDPDPLRSLLYGLGMRRTEMPDTAAARVGAYRSLTNSRRMLIVLDNVGDPARIRSLLPNSPACMVLLTGRQRLLTLAVRDGAHLLTVDVPDLRGARELLALRMAGRPYVPGPGQLDEIIERCGRVPLALATLAGAASS